MRSCIYDCKVMHHRLEPLRNSFVYSVYMLYLDLDELDTLHAELRLFSRNRRNVFEFRDSDHLSIVPGDVRTNIRAYLQQQGIDKEPARIFLLTHPRTFGHVFNPVSFYFCFDEDGSPLCVVPEVGNTFREQKPYFLGSGTLGKDGFRTTMQKFFYVSPFIDMDTWFDFDLRIPGEKLLLRIDDVKDGKKFFLSSLSGTMRELNDRALAFELFRVPFVTLKVLGLIHLQAVKLWWKKLPFHRKTDNPDLQKDMIVWNK